MKKLSTYFLAAVFFVALYPRQCDWPNPSEDLPNSASTILQPTIDNNNLNATNKLT